MLDNSWYPKLKPLMGLMGFGGGATALNTKSAGGVGAFTVNGSSERPAKEGYSTPTSGRIGGSHFSIEVTAGPFVATVKLWGGGGGSGGPEGGVGGSGGFLKADFEFLEGEQYEFVQGGGGHISGQGAQPYGGGGAGRKPSTWTGAGGGGGGASGMFKAPAPTPAANTRVQTYAVLVVGGGGGSGGSTGEAGIFGDMRKDRRGGSGGSAYPPAALPFGPPDGNPPGGPTTPSNYGGGYRDTPGGVVIRGDSGRGNGAGQGAPRTTGIIPMGWPDQYGGERGGYYPAPTTPQPQYGFGQKFEGDSGLPSGGDGTTAGGGGAGGGGGYWGGGGSGTPTNPDSGGGGGGGGFITVPTVHPEGIGAIAPFGAATGLRGPQVPQFTPQPTITDRYDPVYQPLYRAGGYDDPDWDGDLPTGAGAGNSGIYGGPNYGHGPWSDPNAGGWAGRVVIKQE